MTAEKKPLKNPEISVIVPVYKVEKYLNECIDSILGGIILIGIGLEIFLTGIFG